MDVIWETTLAAFLVLTCVLGGGAAWMTGLAMARGWRPAWRVILYMALLGVAVRFFHFAMAGGTMLSAHFYVVDTVLLTAAGLLSFRIARTTQMVTQYPWLYRRSSPFGWTAR